MSAFVLHRLFQAVIVMVAVAFIAFMLFQYVGDPVVFLLGQDATPDQIRTLRADPGLDQPLVVQFWHFLVNAAQGESGLRLRRGSFSGEMLRLFRVANTSSQGGRQAAAVGRSGRGVAPPAQHSSLQQYPSRAIMALDALGPQLPAA